MQAETLAVAAERPERLHRPGPLDHLFGGGEHHGRHGNAQRFRGRDLVTRSDLSDSRIGN